MFFPPVRLYILITKCSISCVLHFLNQLFLFSCFALGSDMCCMSLAGMGGAAVIVRWWQGKWVLHLSTTIANTFDFVDG